MHDELARCIGQHCLQTLQRHPKESRVSHSSKRKHGDRPLNNIRLCPFNTASERRRNRRKPSFSSSYVTGVASPPDTFPPVACSVLMIKRTTWLRAIQARTATFDLCTSLSLPCNTASRSHGGQFSCYPGRLSNELNNVKTSLTNTHAVTRC